MPRMETANPDSIQTMATQCDNCGVRKRPARLSLGYMLYRLKEEVFGTERGLLLTIWHLFSRPQLVTSAFISGDSMRYYSPIKYFIVMLAASVFISSDSPLDYSTARFIANKGLLDPASAKAFVADWNAFLYIPMIAMLALATRGFFRATKMNYAEHLVVAAYGWSQVVLISTFAHLIIFVMQGLGLKGLWLLISAVITPAYWFWYCHAVFGQKNLAGWLRAFVTVPAAIIGYMFLLIIAVSSISVAQAAF